MCEVISGKGINIDEADGPLIQFENFLVEKPSDDYDFEYDMTVVAWTVTMAMTSIRLIIDQRETFPMINFKVRLEKMSYDYGSYNGHDCGLAYGYSHDQASDFSGWGD